MAKTKKKKAPEKVKKFMTTVHELVKTHPTIWTKEFDDLTPNEMADFMSVFKISFLSRDKDWGNYDEVLTLFNQQKEQAK